MTEQPHSPPPEQAPAPPPRRRRARLVVGLLAFAHLVGALSSLNALMETRTSPGTVAWIVSLNTFPVVAVPAYWVFGRTRFQGYVSGRRDVGTELHRALEDKLSRIDAKALQAGLSADDIGRLQPIERLAKLPMLGGNRAELLIDGEATFASLFAGIDAARDYLLVQFYIVRDDGLGTELQRRLIARARAGVRVLFLYDEVGSYQLSQRYVDELVQAGVEVRRFHSTRGSGNRFQFNFRNHRKIVVADGRLVWLGGFNVGDEYLREGSHPDAWRDTHLKIEGPAVLGAQLSFVEDWHWATSEVLELDWAPVEAAQPGLPVLVMPTGPGDRFETASLMMQHVIHSARSRLWISSPYFVPDEGVLAALKLAALRGVDVRVLIPERSDNVLTTFAAYAFLGPLLDAGVQVYRYQGGFLHTKAVLVDEDLSAVGTVNLDNRSLRLNFEVTAWLLDGAFATGTQAMFDADFARSRRMSIDEVAQKPLWHRAASRLAFLLAPVL